MKTLRVSKLIEEFKKLSALEKKEFIKGLKLPMDFIDWWDDKYDDWWDKL